MRGRNRERQGRRKYGGKEGGREWRRKMERCKGGKEEEGRI